MQLTQEQEVDIFKHLAYKSAYETGLEFGLDKTHKDAKAIRNAITNIYNKVKKNSDRYGISNDIKTLVQDAMANRQIATTRNNIVVAEKEIDSDDIKKIIPGVRDKAWKLIDRKLSRAGRTNKALDAVSFRDLGTLAGISFDKSQIISGQATEHVALMGKIEGNINPQDALALVLKMREATVASKQKS